jgi:putative membrane protein
MMGIQLTNVVNAILYAGIGIVIFGLAFLIIDKFTPYNLWKEIVQEHNTALAILLGAMSLGVCVIIAAAVH